MSRRSDDSGRHYYRTDQQIVDEPDSYVQSAPPPAVVPVKKKSKWKQIFSRKGKGKRKASTHVEHPLPPLPPPSRHTDSYGEPPLVIQHPRVPASDISTSRRYELSDPGFARPVPRRMSTTQSRAESLRASELAREQGARDSARVSAREGSALGHRRELAEETVVSRHEHHSYSEHAGSYLDPGPLPMLVDEQTGNRIPRETSFASRTGSHQVSFDGVPVKKKKRSFGGTLKRLFSRKKKVPPPVVHSSEPPASHFVEIEETHPLPPAPPRTHSSRSSAAAPPVMAPRTHSSRSSAGPPAMSPRSSHSHRSAFSPAPEVVIPVSPRASTPVAVPVVPTRRGTGSTVVSVSRPPRRYDTAPSIGAVPKRHNTGSSFGLGRQNTGSSFGARLGARPAPAPAPVLSQVTGSASPSIRSVKGHQSWGEVQVPPETPPPVTTTRSRYGLGRTGLGPASRPAPAARAPARRTYTAPPARAPYVHVPRPIPPPPRYPTLPTATATTTAGALDAQVQLIVTALRDLAAEDRHRRDVTHARMEEERAWTAAERERDAELRELVIRLASSRAGARGARLGVGEFGTREVRTETSSVVEETRPAGEFGTTAIGGVGTTGLGTARLAGLGVGGSDIQRLLDIMEEGHQVTMQTYRDLIDRWRRDIEIKHRQFLDEQEAIRDRRERARVKPIRWQPGVNMW